MRLGRLSWVAVAFGVSALAGTVLGGRADATSDLDERLLTDSVQDEVAITATFSGSEIFVYGAIERSRFLSEGEPEPDIAISLRGPSAPVMVRRKERVAGIWVNREAVRVAQAPSYYAVASTGPLTDILRDDEDRTFRVSINRSVLILGAPTSADAPEQFHDAVIRIRRDEGFYREQPDGVQMRGATLYAATFVLPANIIEGDYTVQVFLIRDQRVIDQVRHVIPIRKTGLERFLFVAAKENSALYGVGTLLMALLAGWGVSELFRRLRRR